VIAAHPDDEILGLGGRLAQISTLTLIHLTDGAPRDMVDARRAGFSTREEYAHARERELDRALAGAEVTGARRRALGEVDQESVRHLIELTRGLTLELKGVDAAITHSYEGGHPDHDACALIVQSACALLERASDPVPVRLEFASYHERNGQIAAGVFWSLGSCPEQTFALDGPQLTRKRAAIERYVSQYPVIGAFPIEIERLRLAPNYDFSLPPPPRAVLYDRFGWRMHSALWRHEARRALAALELLPQPENPAGAAQRLR
jgi:LmbE family N-acetylglucosaminyl deacetylase